MDVRLAKDTIEEDKYWKARSMAGAAIYKSSHTILKEDVTVPRDIFAEFIQKEMSDRLPIRNRGVKQANFVVLQGAKMSAVLVETAFLSNPAEEQMLADSDFHRQVADGLVEAIRNMRKRYR